MKLKRRPTLVFLGALALVSSSMAFTEEEHVSPPGAKHDDKSHVVAGLDDVKWGPAPPALPPGAQAVVLAGDPAASGLVTLRVKFPAGYTVPPHWHPSDEHVTVLSGTLSLGMGDKVDVSSAKTLTAGGYIVAPARMHHFATTKTGAVVQIHLNGPFGITYVNPADDPRSPATQKSK